MQRTLLQALCDHFTSVFAGPNGDYPALMESLAGVTAEQGGWKPAPNSNSIWQIVNHQTASNYWQIEMLENGAAATPEWTVPAGSEHEWEESLARLRESQDRLHTALAKLTDADLLAIPEPGGTQTLLELLLSSAAHEAHHGGQIDYLKGLQSE
jgi:uncharacterized damage-inducible protein DinB